MKIRLEQKVRLLDGDLDTPISLYLKIAGKGEGILLESAEVDGRWGRYSVIAGDFLLELICRGGKLHMNVHNHKLKSLCEYEGLPFIQGLKAVMQDLELVPDPASPDLPPITRALYGYFGYGLAGLFEPKLMNFLSSCSSESRLVLPGTVILFDHLYNKISYISLHDEFRTLSSIAFEEPEYPEIGEIAVSPNQQEYMSMVSRVKNLIHQGEAIQVVVSTRFSAGIKGSGFALYRNLRRINPSPYMFYMQFDGLTLLGSSPEALVRCENGRLSLSPIAGTRPRGSTEGEDNIFQEELAADPKERAEHVMLVDLGRNDLSRISQAGSVKVERFMEVEKFSHVMHLTSYLTADVLPGVRPIDVIASTFPAGTVSGAPKIRAMEIIAEEEKGIGDRGPYAGAIGWLGLDHDQVHLDTGITIRSLWIKDEKAYWQAGAGIVYDSEPAAEWKECNNKAAAVYAAVSGGRDVSSNR